MFGLFKPKARCSVDAVVKDWIDDRWAWLGQQFGADRVRRQPVILPTEECFPDAYSASTPGALATLCERVAGFMSLDPKRIRFELFDDSDQRVGRSAGGIYYGRDDDGISYIGLNIQILADPENLVAVLAHEYCHIHLLGEDRIAATQYDHELLTDLTCVFMGFGVFMANNCMVSKAWSTGNWHYTQIGRQGYFDMHQYGYALAKYAETRTEDDRQWGEYLRPDLRKAFRESLRFLTETPNAPPPAPDGTADPSKLRLWALARRDEITFDRLHFVYEAYHSYRNSTNAAVLRSREFLHIVEDFAWDNFDQDCRETLQAWGLITGTDLKQSIVALYEVGLIDEIPVDLDSNYETYGPLLTREPVFVDTEPDMEEMSQDDADAPA